MKHLAFALSMSAVILTAQTAPAQVGVPLDHMVCYKTLDGLHLPQPNSTDLLAQLQPEFTQKGCRLIKAVEFCVPATKTNVLPFPPDPNIHGMPLKNDYICYLAQCKNQIPPPDKNVIDQFGLRLQQNYHLSKVCVPAIKGPANCPEGQHPGHGVMCTGGCANHTDLCKTVQTPTGPICQCVHHAKPCGGAPDKAGHCGGDCLNSGDQCVLTQVTSSTGTVAVKCACAPPKDPICSRDATTGACGGKCMKDTQKCVVNELTGQCDCEDPIVPCHVTGTVPALTCGGSCELPGQTCQPDALTGKCSCNPPAQCAQDLTGACGGPCGSGMSCIMDSMGHCGCHDTPCGSNGLVPPSCGGACSLPSQSCVLDTTGACNCLPNLPCQSDGAGACGGACPAPQLCRNVNGTPACACQ